MATLAVGKTSRAGLDLAAGVVAASGGGDKFANTGVEHLYVKNGSGAPITLTFAVVATVDGLAAANRTVVVGATTGSVLIGPFPTNVYNDANGFVNITYSGVTSLSVQAFQPATG